MGCGLHLNPKAKLPPQSSKEETQCSSPPTFTLALNPLLPQPSTRNFLASTSSSIIVCRRMQPEPKMCN